MEGHRSGTRSMSSIISRALLKRMLTATDSTHRCNRMPWQSTVIHRGMRRHFFGLQGTWWMQNSAKGASCTSIRGKTNGPHHLASVHETALVSPDIGLVHARGQCYGLATTMRRKCWYYFPKMQMDEVSLFKQFELDTALIGRMTFHTSLIRL